VSLEHINALIPRLVAEILEEDPASEEGHLDCVEVDVGFVPMPGYCANDVRGDGAKDTAEEEEKEEDDDDDDDEFQEEDPVIRCARLKWGTN
jgi:hypothetical protein